jgi:dimeric dUTPase (all-alpha-NTP-PPase superfamily)
LKSTARVAVQDELQNIRNELREFRAEEREESTRINTMLREITDRVHFIATDLALQKQKIGWIAAGVATVISALIAWLTR